MGKSSDPGLINRIREDQRNAEIAENRRRVNEVFDGAPIERLGINPVDNFEVGRDYYDAEGNKIDPLALQTKYLADLDEYNALPDLPEIPDRIVRGINYGGGSPGGKGRAAPIKPGQAFSDVTETGGGGFDEDYFTGIADAYIKFQTPLLEQQIQEARRQQPSQYGSTRSSAYQRNKGFLEKDYAREQVDIADRAQDFTNQHRVEIERNRSDLLNMANSETDSSAIAQMAAARQHALQKPPTFSPVADLFAKYTKSGAQAAQSNALGNIYAQSNLSYGAPKGAVKTVS